jgi:hypothetical protein
MSQLSMLKTLGLISAIAMPLFDIPLIVRIVRRKSSEDISLVWTFGIWGCALGMLPTSIVSNDSVLSAFAVVNVLLFSAVVVAVLWYHPTVRKKFLRP